MNAAIPYSDTLLLMRHDVTRLLTIEECIYAVEQAFKLHSPGKSSLPGVLGIQAKVGSF